MIILFSTLTGIALAYSWEYFCTHVVKKTELRVFGWKLHHSLYGILLIMWGIPIQNSILVGLGIGILVQHTLTDGFRFITKK